MSSKKKASKQLFEGMSVEPEHADQAVPESTPAPEEHTAAETTDQVESAGEEATVPTTDVVPQDQPQPEQEQSSTDDILEDVRRSLIEEEQVQEEERPWWKRIGRGSRKKAVQEELPKPVEEMDLPNLEALETTPTSEEINLEPEPEPELDPIDELIDMLDKDETAKQSLVVYKEPQSGPAPEPEKVVDIEDLKKQAFQPRPASDQEEDISEVRSVALDGGEEVFVEVQSTRQDPLEERLSAMENALKPYRRYINFALAALGLVMAVIAGLVLFNLYQQSAAAPSPEPVVVSNLPFPTSVSLPGGWTFKLGRGALDSGQWNPKGAEWLQGTEVCRWVALPWSRQLEAVVRTLNREDPINLGMSNNDQLTYKVYSIQQMSPEEMQGLDSNTPCLLIVLAEPGAEKRWVLTAMP